MWVFYKKVLKLWNIILDTLLYYRILVNRRRNDATGIYEDIPTAVEQMVQIDRVIEPNSQVHAEYQPFYEAYKASYVGLKNIRNNLEN